MKIRVVLADDHAIIRDAVRGILERSDLKVVGEADNGRDAVRLASELHPDIIVMDIGMSSLNGIEATRQIIRDCPEVRVVALSMHSSREFVSEILKAGACGYVVKEAALEEVVAAVRAAAEGRVFLSEKVADVVVNDYVRQLSGAAAEESRGSRRALSPREREVLQLAAEGHSTKEIASILQVSVKTVETHRRQIMEKTGIFNLAGLVKHAIREGLTSLE
jgi:DNA-binding NarL/FixJ family response regulator